MSPTATPLIKYQPVVYDFENRGHFLPTVVIVTFWMQYFKHSWLSVSASILNSYYSHTIEVSNVTAGHKTEQGVQTNTGDSGATKQMKIRWYSHDASKPNSAWHWVVVTSNTTYLFQLTGDVTRPRDLRPALTESSWTRSRRVVFDALWPAS